MKRPPLMITGDTGVGKSLFVRIYETLYREDQPQREGIPGKRVVRINAAAFNENLILSELFGHVQGAFTGALKKKDGLVETADLLIIEEIGELSREAQAKLLTFIEDGYYYPVGSVQAKTAKDIQIVATTNKKKEDFRSDFYNRFFHFRVPSLHERRADVICHLAILYPRLIKELIPSELMSLVAYNWPGNVREVETVVREILWRKDQDNDNVLYKTKIFPILVTTLSKSQTGFRWDDCRAFCQSLRMNGVDVAMLDKVLNTYGLGLDGASKKHPFSHISDNPILPSSEGANDFDRRFNTITVKENEVIEKVRAGLHLYGAIFMCHNTTDKSLFEVRNMERSFSFNPMAEEYGLQSIHEELLLDIARYVIGQDPIWKIPFPKGIFRYGPFISETFEKYEKDPYPLPQEKKETDNLKWDPKDIPTDISEDELLGIYYRKLLKETHGVQKAAAARAGLNPDAFRKRLKKMGIMRKEDS
jgi:transcriptional regulator with AAA-type ATPase domain